MERIERKTDNINMFSLVDLIRLMKEKGVSRLYSKPLSENDNSKNQIYLGTSYEAFQILPHGEIVAYSELKRPNFKARVNLIWIDENGNCNNAPNAQMILYPKYPEVRLSGFLSGCKNAPSDAFRVISKSERTGEKDGKFLFFGIAGETIFAYVTRRDSFLSKEMYEKFMPAKELFIEVPLIINDTEEIIIAKLIDIYNGNPHELMRMEIDGSTIPYYAPNAPGYTLEALFGVIPNGKAEPDFMGWELKAHTQSVITLMTPQPDGGLHAELGAREFISRFGHPREDGTIYYTGITRVAEGKTYSYLDQEETRHLAILGYDYKEKKITDVNGCIAVIDHGETLETWSFSHILSIWSRKHDKTCYVRAKRTGNLVSYEKNVILCKKTSPTLLLDGITEGIVYYDPASKTDAYQRLKLRSQFRVKEADLSALYYTSRQVDLSKF